MQGKPPKYLHEDFKFPVREFRDRHNLNQTELGVIVGVSRSVVSGWERGEIPLDRKSYLALSAVETRTTDELRRVLAAHRPKRPKPSEPPADVRLMDFFRQAVDSAPQVRPRDPSDPDGRQVVIPDGVRQSFRIADLARDLTVISAGSLVPHTHRWPSSGPLALNSRLQLLGAEYSERDTELSRVWPIVVTDPVAQWLTEEEELTVSDPVYSTKSTDLHTVGLPMIVSRQLLKLTGPAGYDDVLRSVFRSLARAIDFAAISGDNVKQPEGVTTNTDVPTQDAGLSPDAAMIDTAIETLETAGVDSGMISAVAPPAVRKALASVSYDGRNAWRNAQSPTGSRLAGLVALSNAAVPAKELLFGDFSTMRIVHSEMIDMVARPNAKGRIELFMFMECDVLIRHPDAFLRVVNVV